MAGAVFNKFQAQSSPVDSSKRSVGRNAIPASWRLPRNSRPTLTTDESKSRKRWSSKSRSLLAGGCGGNGGGKSHQHSVSEYDDDGGNIRKSLALAALLAVLSGMSPLPAQALSLKKKKKKKPVNRSIDQYSDRLVTLGWPIAQNLGFSGAIGFATAFALKAVGSALALAFGALFILVQGAAYLGYIEVKWTYVHKEVIRRLDINRDGKFDASDAKAILASGLAVLSQGVPSVGGFLAGFALGLK